MRVSGTGSNDYLSDASEAPMLAWLANRTDNVPVPVPGCDDTTGLGATGDRYCPAARDDDASE